MEKLGDLLALWLDDALTLQLHKRGIILLGSQEQTRIEALVDRHLAAISALVEDKKKK